MLLDSSKLVSDKFGVVHYSQSSSHNQKKSGLFGNGGASFTLGTQKTANDNRTDSTTHTGSVVGTYNGNTVLTAGDHYQQTGSKIFAQNQTTDNLKDLNYGTTVINAKSANVTNTTATTKSHNSQSQKTTGLTVSVSNSLIDQAQGINSLVKAGETTNSDQMKVMAGVAGFNKLRTLKNGIEDAMNPMIVDKAGHSIKKDTEQTLKGIGNTRIQATIGSQSSKSNQDSLSGNNEASSIDTNNLVLNIQGKGKDSDFVATGSDLNVKGDLYNNVEGDVVYQAATGKGYERSSNKSSGYGVGVYADSKSQGFTVNANTAKGYGNGETTTNANSHVTVGGTTYQNIGGDLVLDGAVVKGDNMTGHIDGAILAKSRPDTATYTGKQTNAGVSADIGFDGVPQSVSVNAGRSKVNADYAAVKEQTGIAMNSSDVVVAKASRFDGAYFTTATPEDNQTVFKEGVTTTDIQNHMNYKGDAINVGLGAGINPETQKVSPPGISGIGYGKDGNSQTSITYGAVTGMAGKSDVTTANVSSLNKPLKNSFDKTAVEAQLGAQVQVSQAFDTERRTYRLEMAKDEEKLRKEAKEAIEKGDEVTWRAKSEQADKQQEKMVLFDSITGAIYGPNTNGVTGYVARAVAPEVSFRIGQYFKENHGEGTAPHILAHGILAAAVSAATGNDPTTGALSAMGAEAAARMVAKFLFGDKPISELTAEQKATVSSITSLAGLGLGSTTGNVGSAVSAGETAKVAVEDNWLSVEEIQKMERELTRAEASFFYKDSDGEFDPAEIYEKYAKISEENSEKTAETCKVDPIQCQLDIFNMKVAYQYINSEDYTNDNDTIFNEVYDELYPVVHNAPNEIINPDNLPEVTLEPITITGTGTGTEQSDRYRFIEYENLNDISKYVDPKTGKDIQDYLDTKDYKYTNQPLYSKPWGSMYVIPSLQVGGGILSGIGGTALLGTCETVVGCVAGGYLIASGSDDIVAGSKNWGVEPAKQSATAREEILRSLGMSPTGAMWSSLALDLSAGGTGAFSDIARVNRLNAATNAEIDAARIENNVNIDNPSLTTSGVREFKATANHPITYRAENINTGQVVDRDGLVRVDSAKSSNDAQVATNLGLASSRDLDYYLKLRSPLKKRYHNKKSSQRE